MTPGARVRLPASPDSNDPQRGATALETAIILVAFVVVASVFAYVVLSAGLFASERSKDAATAGLDSVSSTLELIGDVKADGQPATTVAGIDGAGGWALAAGVTAATEGSDYKTGAAGVQLTVGGAFASGLVASYDLPGAVDLSDHYAASVWLKASAAAGAGTFRLVLDDSAGCGSPEESLDLPALTANEWAKPRLKLADPGALTAIACVGISAPSDPGALTLLVDQVEGPAEVQAVHVAVSNTLKTNAVTFTTTADTDADGLLSDEVSPSHHMIVSFLNNETIVRDVAWSYSALGMTDGDVNLEYGETFLISIDLRAVDPIPTSRSLIGLEIAPYGNGAITLEKIVPPQVSTSMVLR